MSELPVWAQKRMVESRPSMAAHVIANQQVSSDQQTTTPTGVWAEVNNLPNNKFDECTVVFFLSSGLEINQIFQVLIYWSFMCDVLYIHHRWREHQSR